jgi:hypothetical protein
MPDDGTIIESRDAGWTSGRGGSSPMPTGRDAIEPWAVAALVLVPLLALAAVVSLPAEWTIPAGGGLALALFIPVLCALSVVMKHNKSVLREQGARRIDELRFTQYFQIYDQHPLPSIIRQTWFPILVMFLFNLYFAQLLVYTPPLSAKAFGNFLLLGHRYSLTGPQADEYLRQSFDVMCFAYLGWYVWTVSVIFSRIITMELVAATYYNALVRLVVAVFVALVFNHIQMIAFSGGTAFIAEAVGFGVGLFPDAALVSISKRLRRYLLAADEQPEEFPLDLIQGISPCRKLRLFEMGMDNCENLASANAVELFLTSNLKLVEVADWIGQAQLVVLVGAKGFLTLQQNGYRTIIDLHRASHSPAGPVVAGLLDFKQEQLVDLADGLEQDPSYRRLTELRLHLCQQVQPGAGPAEAAPPQG